MRTGSYLATPSPSMSHTASAHSFQSGSNMHKILFSMQTWPGPIQLLHTGEESRALFKFHNHNLQSYQLRPAYRKAGPIGGKRQAGITRDYMLCYAFTHWALGKALL